MNPHFQSARGMHDILPADQKYFNYFLEKSEKLAKFYGFKKINTPIVEKIDLFIRSVGKNTDIVDKEMFKIISREKGERLCLRPENTAPVCRAYLENGLSSLPQPVKLYYFGPMFRHDRPQSGRFRQFYQFGAEIIGTQDAVCDAQIIQLTWQLLKKLGLKNLDIKINSIGCPECRDQYLSLLKNHFKGKTSSLCTDCNRRLRNSPLRVLDCKIEKCRQLANEAPQSIDYLCTECHEHFKNLLEFLDELDLPYDLDSKLVRGLDYYTKTVFEIWPQISQASQGALGGGGRYDGLIKLLGGKETPGVGVSLGVERIIEQIKLQKIKIKELENPKIFLAQVGSLAKKKALKLFHDLEESNIRTAEVLARNSLKSQLRTANKLKVKLALILGQKEALEGNVILRDMETGVQEVLPLKKIIEQLKKRLR